MTRSHPHWPLIVAYGAGVDSTAVLVEFANRSIRPDLILFADTGGEKPETYAYLETISDFLMKKSFPAITTVRYKPKTAPYHTLEQQCLHTGTLPSDAYGGRSCSIKYKRTPQDRFVEKWPAARNIWKLGGKVVKVIGFDASEVRRIKRMQAKIPNPREKRRFHYWYPLFDWGWCRADCVGCIQHAGLPVPMKSACFYCPASKKHEIAWLRQQHPDLTERALEIERNAQAKLISVKGLGRSFTWQKYLNELDAFPLFAGEEPCS